MKKLFTLKKQISVIGCGWLGLPLAIHLQNQGYKIKGSTTSKEKLETLNKASIMGFIIHINERGVSGNVTGFLSGSDTVIINIPPGLRKNPNKNHVSEIKHLIDILDKQSVKNILYISSISVFKNKEIFPVIKADIAPNATSNSSKQLIEIEDMLLQNTNFNTTILRFGGLFDAQRHPSKYLSGKKNVLNPDAPINLIHKEDCIAIITSIIKNNHWNKVLNVAYPKHPTKKEYYISYCKQHNLSLPEFNSSEKSKGKIIDSTKLVQLLNYNFEQAP